MLPQEIIRKKRNRQPLSADEISEFIKGITDGSIMDAQTAALTMAVFLNGLNADETVALTMAMRAGTVAGSLWRLCADDFRTRARPHRRHTR